MGVGGGPMVPGGPMKGPGGMPDFGPPVPAGATAAAPPSLVPGTQGQPPRGPMDPMAAMAGLMPGSAGPGASGAGLGAVLAGTPQQQGIKLILFNSKLLHFTCCVVPNLID